MKAYKGFNKDMTCRGFQFEEGKAYEEPEAKPCESGFHACENPLDCLSYYSPANSVFHEVELEDVNNERREDSKVCAKRITIGARLSFAGIVKWAVSFVFDKVKSTTGYWAHAATTGDWAHAATTGDWAHAATSGQNSISAALGVKSSAKAAAGSWIVCTEYSQDGKLLGVKAAKIDNDTIKADTWYELVNGEFVEVE
jgi:hypothetical protein